MIAERQAKTLKVFEGLQSSVVYMSPINRTRSEVCLEGEEAKRALLTMLGGDAAFPDMPESLSLKKTFYINNLSFECPHISNGKWDSSLIQSTVDRLYVMLYTRLNVGFALGQSHNHPYYVAEEKTPVHLKLSTPDPPHTFVLYRTHGQNGIIWRIVYPVFDKRSNENEFVVRNQDKLRLAEAHNDAFFAMIVAPSTDIFQLYASKKSFDAVPPPSVYDLLAFSRFDFHVVARRADKGSSA